MCSDLRPDDDGLESLKSTTTEERCCKSLLFFLLLSLVVVVAVVVLPLLNASMHWPEDVGDAMGSERRHSICNTNFGLGSEVKEYKAGRIGLVLVVHPSAILY